MGRLQRGPGRVESITNEGRGERVTSCWESRETSGRRLHCLGPERLRGLDPLSQGLAAFPGRTDFSEGKTHARPPRKCRER